MRIDLANADGVQTHAVTAYRTAIPQLATHRRLNGRGEAVKGCWDVTHVPTGLKLTYRGIETRALAKAFAACLTALDWTFTAENMPKGARANAYGKVINSARCGVLMGDA